MSNDLETTESQAPAVQHPARTSASTRRAVLAGAGALGTTVVLAACGTDKTEPTTAPPAGGAATPTAGTAPTAAVETSSAPSGGGTAGALAAKSDVPVGGGVILKDQKVVVTQPTEGEFKAFSAVCTHQGCLVTSVAEGAIQCKCHQSTFSATDGSVKGGPARAPLEEKPVKVDGDSIVAA